MKMKNNIVILQTSIETQQKSKIGHQLIILKIDK